MLATGVTYPIIQGLVVLIVLLALLGWALFRWLKHSKDDPAVLIIKWIVTIPVAALALFSVSLFGLIGPFVIVVCGVVLSVIWAPNIGAWLINPLTSAIDGGDTRVEPQPFYSIAVAKRKKGQYLEAVAEIRKVLAQFPDDFEGQMMLAEIQAEHLNDLPGAEITIQRLCHQPGRAPAKTAAALNALADWQLRFAQDREAARQSLQQLVDWFPETELAHAATQRLAHLAPTGHLLAPHDRQPLPLHPGAKNIGLLQSSAHLAPSETDPARVAASYVAHLQQHPLDAEAREKLAIVYADHYRRLDLAADQLEQLLSQPNPPARLIAHWLNLLANLQIRHGADPATVRRTLERIIERLPNHSAAELARNRLDRLRLELKAKTENQPVKLGSYEQDIGLKHPPPGGRRLGP